METSLISIIIVTYNGLPFLKKCLPTIFNQTYSNIEIILVDNNSSDQTVSQIMKYFPKVKIIKNDTNEGFAKANNIGVNNATGEFVFLLNNDTELFPDVVEKLVISHRPKSILTALQIPTRDKKGARRAGAGADIFGYPYLNCKHPEKTKLFYADGAAMFLKKEDFMTIGGFDEQLFMFQEDIDFSWRARIFGYDILPVPASKLYHYYGGTATLKADKKTGYTTSYFRRYLNERNVIRNILKNYSLPFLLPVLIVLIVLHTVEMIVLLLLGKWKASGCYLKAYIWNAQNISNTLSVRNALQLKRKISDVAIIRLMYLTYAKIHLLFHVGIPNFK